MTDEQNLSSLDNFPQINCNFGSNQSTSVQNPQESSLLTSDNSSGAKPKRKSRSNRRRLHAMMSNVSLHFSDTDSEGELTQINTQRTTTKVPKIPLNIPQAPTISVTLENSETEPVDLHWDGFGGIPKSESRNSFAENLTDVDEIYGSDEEHEQRNNKSLMVMNNAHQGETDVEDMSNDEEDDDELAPPIYVKPALDILREFGGGTITTKEGDGPFSVELRNQMSFDEGDDDRTVQVGLNDSLQIHGGTDSEDIDASDDEDELQGAWGQKDVMDDFDLLATSQVVMKNVNKMENSLNLLDIGDEGICDGHTDIEDVD